MKYLSNFIFGLIILSASPLECDDGGGGEEELFNDIPAELYNSKNHNGVFDGVQGSTGELWASMNYTDNDLKISKVTVKYKIEHFFGEPLRTAVMKWEGSGNIYSFTWAGQLFDRNGDPILLGGSPVYFSHIVGTINGPGEGYGIDISGSPDWSELFVFLNTETLNTSFGISKESAIDLYKADFVLGNLILLEVNDKKVK